MNLKHIIEDSDTPSGRAFDLAIQFLIILSLVSFSIETLPDLSEITKQVLNIAEVIIVLIFTVEYLLRVIVADRKLRFVFSFYGMVDILAILPFYLTLGADLRSVRIFRLFRLLRVFKIFRYSSAVDRFKVAFVKIREELVLFGMATAHACPRRHVSQSVRQCRADIRLARNAALRCPDSVLRL